MEVCRRNSKASVVSAPKGVEDGFRDFHLSVVRWQNQNALRRGCEVALAGALSKQLLNGYFYCEPGSFRMLRQNLSMCFILRSLSPSWFHVELLFSFVLVPQALICISKHMLEKLTKAIRTLLNLKYLQLMCIFVLTRTSAYNLNGKFRLSENERIFFDSVARMSDLSKKTAIVKVFRG
jgi:hypothetical protein